MHSVFLRTFLIFAVVLIVVQLLGRSLIAQRGKKAIAQAAAVQQMRSND